MRRLVKPLLTMAALLSLSPILVMLASSAMAGILDCRLDEGGQYPCDFAGMDIGEMLHAGFVSAWFMFATLPVLAVCMVGWSVLFVFWVVRRFASGSRRA